MEENKTEIIAKIKIALGSIGKSNGDLDAEIVYNDLKQFAISETQISFDEPEVFKISLNHTLNFKVKKPKSDFQNRIKNVSKTSKNQ